MTFLFLAMFEFAQHFQVLTDNNNMAEDFTCRVISAQDQGAAHIETLSCAPSTDSGETRIVEIARVTFPPEKLNLVDINAKRQWLPPNLASHQKVMV